MMFTFEAHMYIQKDGSQAANDRCNLFPLSKDVQTAKITMREADIVMALMEGTKLIHPSFELRVPDMVKVGHTAPYMQMKVLDHGKGSMPPSVSRRRNAVV